MNSDIRGELWGVIVNPYSGKRQLAKDWIKIYRLLKKADIRFDEQSFIRLIQRNCLLRFSVIQNHIKTARKRN